MPEVEFGTKTTVDAYRTEHPEFICPDDARLKKVRFTSDTPDWLLEQAETEAASGRAGRMGPGQLALTDQERSRIDWDIANVPQARSVKAVMTDEGVDDWLSSVDPVLNVDEHREIAERAAREERGKRLDEEPTIDERLATAEKAVGGSCDHARGHCEHGDPAACEHLRHACGYDDQEIDQLLNSGLSIDDRPDQGDQQQSSRCSRWCGCSRNRQQPLPCGWCRGARRAGLAGGLQPRPTRPATRAAGTSNRPGRYGR